MINNFKVPVGEAFTMGRHSLINGAHPVANLREVFQMEKYMSFTTLNCSF